MPNYNYPTQKQYPPLSKTEVKRYCHAVQAELTLYKKYDTKDLTKLDELSDLTLEDITKIINKSRYARQILILSNKNLIMDIARKYYRLRNNSREFNDLVHEGIFGLNHAIDKFNPNLDYALSTYAYNWISVYIKRATHRLDRLIRYPAREADQLWRIYTCVSRKPVIEHPVTYQKVSDTTTLSVDLIKTLLNLPKCITTSELGEEELEKMECITVGDNYLEKLEGESLRDNLREVMQEVLTEQQLAISLLHFGFVESKIFTPKKYRGEEQLTLSQLGTILGVSRERARQLINQSILELKKYFKYYKKKEQLCWTT